MPFNTEGIGYGREVMRGRENLGSCWPLGFLIPYCKVKGTNSLLHFNNDRSFDTRDKRTNAGVDLGGWAGWLATLSFGEAKRNKFEKGLL